MALFGAFPDVSGGKLNSFDDSKFLQKGTVLAILFGGGDGHLAFSFKTAANTLLVRTAMYVISWSLRS